MDREALENGLTILRVVRDVTRRTIKDAQSYQYVATREFIGRLAEEIGTVKVLEDPASTGMQKAVVHIVTVTEEDVFGHVFAHTNTERLALNMVDNYQRSGRNHESLMELPPDDTLMGYLVGVVEHLKANERPPHIEISEGYVVFRFDLSWAHGGHEEKGLTKHVVMESDGNASAFDEFKTRLCRGEWREEHNFVSNIAVGLPGEDDWRPLRLEVPDQPGTLDGPYMVGGFADFPEAPTVLQNLRLANPPF